MGILWHKNIGTLPVEGITSDHLCTACFSIDGGIGSIVTLIGVHLPCTDQGLDCYTDHLIELENIINKSLRLGQVIVLGDFKVHVGVSWGE